MKKAAPKAIQRPHSANKSTQVDRLRDIARAVNAAEAFIPGGIQTAYTLRHNSGAFKGSELLYADRLISVMGEYHFLQELCYTLSRKAGWHGENGRRGDRMSAESFATKIALIHSEVSEALEGYRKDKMDDHLPHRKAVEVELADTVVRIMDLSGALGLDVSGAIIEKLAYNQKRADHKIDARAGVGGKKF